MGLPGGGVEDRSPVSRVARRTLPTASCRGAPGRWNTGTGAPFAGCQVVAVGGPESDLRIAIASTRRARSGGRNLRTRQGWHSMGVGFMSRVECRSKQGSLGGVDPATDRQRRGCGVSARSAPHRRLRQRRRPGFWPGTTRFKTLRRVVSVTPGSDRWTSTLKRVWRFWHDSFSRPCSSMRGASPRQGNH